MKEIKTGWVLFILILLLHAPFCLKAQQFDTDSTFYQRLFKRADKHAWSRWLYNITFEKEGRAEIDTVYVKVKSKKKNPFLKYKGKVIKSINIVVLDPFGYSVNDFYGKKPDYLDRVGNKFHVTTNNAVINNLLLFKQGSGLDPLAISESERLLRLSPYIYDARLYVYKDGTSGNDSVEVMVVVQDKWSTVSWSRFDLLAPDINVSENNFLGIGHQIQEDFIWRSSSKYFETVGRYGIYNIRKSFIQAAAFYSTIKEKQQFGVSFNRPFYSPLAKWAGGLSMIRNNTLVQLTHPETQVITPYALNFSLFEFWGAKSFPMSRRKTLSMEQRSSNFILGAGYFRTDYALRPAMIFDSAHHFQSDEFYVSNFGISIRKYYRDKYLFRFGANEDIPEGFTAEILYGILKRERDQLQYYSGVKMAAGRHFEDLGYLSVNAGFGTFSDGRSFNSGVVNLGTFYFSDLLKINRWHFRQFVRMNIIEGINRNEGDRLNINGTQMYGFSSSVLSANTKLVLNLEFLMYTPYKVLGFQFAPVLYFGLAGLSRNFQSLANGAYYQSYAIGVLIRNEYLVSSTFQFSIGLYPFMPGSANNVIKTNPISSFEVRARDYFISKPEKVAYQ